MKCRHCNSELINTFLDLGFAPPSNAYLAFADLQKPETYFPLTIMACDSCWLVQTLDYADAEELFSESYAYFSSTSSGFLKHAQHYSEKIINRLNLDEKNFVIEIASNDGYLLKNFVEAKIPCLGVEPTDSTADAAEALGIPVLREFFGEKIASQIAIDHKKADLISGNNVYAHVPDINDFTKGLAAVLESSGTITLEFPHLMKLLEFNQFDTIYHEHFSYLSLFSVSKIFASAGLRVYDVEELSTHGGSIRVYGCHDESNIQETNAVQLMLNRELEYGMQAIDVYKNFQDDANQIKDSFLHFLIEASRSGKSIAGYGAAAKGNTLMNYAGIKTDYISFVADAAKAKQGKFLPGTHIPVYHPDRLISEQVDYIIIFPWNIADEVINDLRKKINYSTEFVTFVPELKIESI